jgi:hypothetical protein
MKYLKLILLMPNTAQYHSGSVVEPEPQGAEPFGRSWYTEVSAPAPCQTKVVFKIIIHIE